MAFVNDVLLGVKELSSIRPTPGTCTTTCSDAAAHNGRCGQFKSAQHDVRLVEW
jgi:hypothetical protein